MLPPLCSGSSLCPLPDQPLHISWLSHHHLQEALPEPQPLGRESSSLLYVPAPQAPHSER